MRQEMDGSMLITVGTEWNRRGHCSNVPLQAETACLYVYWNLISQSMSSSSAVPPFAVVPLAATFPQCSSLLSISISFCSQFVSNTNNFKRWPQRTLFIWSLDASWSLSSSHCLHIAAPFSPLGYLLFLPLTLPQLQAVFGHLRLSSCFMYFTCFLCLEKGR